MPTTEIINDADIHHDANFMCLSIKNSRTNWSERPRKKYIYKIFLNETIKKQLFPHHLTRLTGLATAFLLTFMSSCCCSVVLLLLLLILLLLLLFVVAPATLSFDELLKIFLKTAFIVLFFFFASHRNLSFI